MKGPRSWIIESGVLAVVVVAVLLAGLFALSGCGAGTMTLGTTRNLQQSGLLAQILPRFEKQYNMKVTVVAKDTAAEVLKLGEEGSVDVLLVNSMEGVYNLVKNGFGSGNKDVMYGDLVVVGPSADPAQIKGLDCPGKSCKKIGTVGATFVCRGDSSDLNSKAMGYWKKTGIDPTGKAWFVVTGEGMVPTLKVASEKQGYTVTDMLTWLQNEKELNLVKLVEGCTMLFDQYTVVVVNPAKHPGEKLNTQQAENFAKYLAGSEGQQQIGGYKKYSVVLYHPNAPKPVQSPSPGSSGTQSTTTM